MAETAAQVSGRQLIRDARRLLERIDANPVLSRRDQMLMDLLRSIHDHSGHMLRALDAHVGTGSSSGSRVTAVPHDEQPGADEHAPLAPKVDPVQAIPVVRITDLTPEAFAILLRSIDPTVDDHSVWIDPDGVIHVDALRGRLDADIAETMPVRWDVVPRRSALIGPAISGHQILHVWMTLQRGWKTWCQTQVQQLLPHA